MEKKAFLADKRTQQAVIMSLVIIGEVATKIMDRYPLPIGIRHYPICYFT
jgi:uncharacterized protein with HEPN domain